MILGLMRRKYDEAVEVFRSANCHCAALGGGRHKSRGDLQEDGDLSGDILQLEKEKCAGLMPSEMKRLRELEDENSRLKRIVADLTLGREMLQDVIKRKL